MLHSHTTFMTVRQGLQFAYFIKFMNFGLILKQNNAINYK